MTGQPLGMMAATRPMARLLQPQQPSAVLQGPEILLPLPAMAMESGGSREKEAACFQHEVLQAQTQESWPVGLRARGV